MKKFLLIVVAILAVLVFAVVVNYESIAYEWKLFEFKKEHDLKEAELSKAEIGDTKIAYEKTVTVENAFAQAEWCFFNSKLDYFCTNLRGESIYINDEELRKHFGELGNEYELALKGYRALMNVEHIAGSCFSEGMPFYRIPQIALENMTFEERCRLLGNVKFLSMTEEDWLSMTEESIKLLSVEEQLELAACAGYNPSIISHTLAKRIDVLDERFLYAPGKHANFTVHFYNNHGPEDVTYEFIRYGKAKFQFGPDMHGKVLPAGEYAVTAYMSEIGEIPITLIIEEDVDAETMEKYNLKFF